MRKLRGVLIVLAIMVAAVLVPLPHGPAWDDVHIARAELYESSKVLVDSIQALFWIPP